MPPSDTAADRNWPSDLSDCLERLPDVSHWLVALSGGLDSTFLLHCLALKARQCSAGLSAIHINHGLQPRADQWAHWCEQQCRALGVPLIQEELRLDGTAPDLEARARQRRYQVFAQHLPAGGVLFMAHHADDQAETVLLRLMRGSGVRGLSGMPSTRILGSGILHRPLLPLRRERIEFLARTWGLDWCEDESNLDTRFDRNYLRHEIVPRLEARWPAAVARINRSAEHAGNADRLLDELVQQDEQFCRRGSGLSVKELATLPEARRHALVRHRLRALGSPLPGERQLATGLDALLTASSDRQPELRWQGAHGTLTLRRFRDRLWLVPALEEAQQGSMAWSPDQPLDWFGGVLESTPVTGQGLKCPEQGGFTVALRRGGERFRPGCGRPGRSLKKWLQEQRIPPWERDHMPLIHHGNELVAIADLWCAPHWQAVAGERGFQLLWRTDSQVL